ncbi:Flp family type IVb pilin [Aeromicrobium sp. Leaf350]|uniref:Flp family type IVb pilin n=1 Tax=Aeromicrobium sp. Leaf350 TaxID=2876565 RepID=UPI001E2B2EE0|nr:SID1 transmembrane family member [Aeromicrobium sp. Leaf350]
MKRLWSTRHADRGASGVEYALLIALVAAIVLIGIVALGEVVPALYDLSFLSD